MKNKKIIKHVEELVEKNPFSIIKLKVHQGKISHIETTIKEDIKN